MRKGRKRKKILRELPSIGTQFIRRWKGEYYNAEIVKDNTKPSGKAVKCCEKLYPSMSAAAVVITKQPTNGWRFWKIKQIG